MDEKLRPLTLGEILDRTTRLYRHNFWTFAGVAALPIVAMFAVFVPFGVVLGFMGVFKAGYSAPDAEIAGIVLAIVLIALPILMVASVVEQAALTRTAIGANAGQRIKVREAIHSVWPRFWTYLGLIVLLGLLVIGVPAFSAGLLLLGGGELSVGRSSALFGLLAFLVISAALAYAVWRWLCYSLSITACIVEEKTAWHSIKRANLLSKGTRGRIFVMYLLVMALTFVVAMIADVVMLIGLAITAALHGSKYGIVATVVGVGLGFVVRLALQILIQPIPIVALVLFYFDQRVRKEGYDIELMMQQAGLASPPAENPRAQAGPQSDVPVVAGPLDSSFSPEAAPDTVKEQ